MVGIAGSVSMMASNDDGQLLVDKTLMIPKEQVLVMGLKMVCASASTQLIYSNLQSF